MNYSKEEPPEFIVNETGPYEDPRDNYFYENFMNPNVQYLFWIQEWKKQHWEIHQNSKQLIQEVKSDKYVKRLANHLLLVLVKRRGKFGIV